jgi:hypothetical protein
MDRKLIANVMSFIFFMSLLTSCANLPEEHKGAATGAGIGAASGAVAGALLGKKTQKAR